MSPLRRLVPAVLATALLATALVAPAAPARAGEPAARPLAGLTFDRYYDNAALEQALRAIAAAYPTFARLESMGTSREGRPLWVLTLADPAEANLDRLFGELQRTVRLVLADRMREAAV